MNQLKSWQQKLLLIVGGVIAGLLIIETLAISTGFAVSQDFKIHHKYFYEFMQPDEQLGKKPRPNLRNFEVKVGVLEEIADTDSFGFRNVGKDYTQSNLYFIGDSFTWGLGMQREKSFYGLIESELNQPVITLGVSSYGFEQYEILFRDWIAKYKPKTAVLSVCTNDLDKVYPLSMLKEYYQIYGFNVYESLPWYKKSFFYQLITQFQRKQKLLKLTYKDKEIKNGLILYSKETLINGRVGTGKDYLVSNVNQVEAALSRIINLAQENKVRLFVFLIPSKESTYIKDYADLFPNDIKYLENEEIGYERLCHLAQAKGVTCVDLTEAFRLHSEGEKLYFDKDSHWNLAGNKLAAQVILDTLKQEKGVDLTAAGT